MENRQDKQAKEFMKKLKQRMGNGNSAAVNQRLQDELDHNRQYIISMQYMEPTKLKA